uniref:threonine--tRNA ligase n=1 Tax=Xenopus tropicalis TaxID=8364 RepID=A0A6I8QDI4_XENTR
IVSESYGFLNRPEPTCIHITGMTRKAIKVTLPDGKQVDAESWKSTPYQIAWQQISLADNTVVAKVNGSVWDLDRPLEEDCTLALLKFDDEEGQHVSRQPLACCSQWPQNRCLFLNSCLGGKFWLYKNPVYCQTEPSIAFYSPHRGY